MNITNNREVMVFEKEGKYTVGISKKNQNGEYEKAYFPIQFNKDIKLENQTLIKIKNAWLSFYRWEYEDKKGTTFFIKCTDFEKINAQNTVNTVQTTPNSNNETSNTVQNQSVEEQLKITDEDLPF